MQLRELRHELGAMNAVLQQRTAVLSPAKAYSHQTYTLELNTMIFTDGHRKVTTAPDRDKNIDQLVLPAIKACHPNFGRLIRL